MCLAFATSWSHKYEELFRDYGMTDCVLDLNDMDAITQRISAFLSAEEKYCHKEVAGGTTTIYQARNLCNVENGLGVDLINMLWLTLIRNTRVFVTPNM